VPGVPGGASSPECICDLPASLFVSGGMSDLALLDQPKNAKDRNLIRTLCAVQLLQPVGQVV
jgi:hypothetical protein